MLITVAKYLTPSGRDITKKGIEPDYLVEVPTEEAADDEIPDEIPEEGKDIQLKKAIEVLKSTIGNKAEFMRFYFKDKVGIIYYEKAIGIAACAGCRYRIDPVINKFIHT